MLSQWLPIRHVPSPFCIFLIPQHPLKGTAREVFGVRQLQERPCPYHVLQNVRMSLCRLNQKLGTPQLPKPEEYLFGCRIIPMVQVVDVDQTANHRPVFVSLRLLGRHEVRQGQNLQRLVLEGESRPPRPKLWKGRDAAHMRHYVDPQSRGFRLPAAEVNREPFG